MINSSSVVNTLWSNPSPRSTVDSDLDTLPSIGGLGEQASSPQTHTGAAEHPWTHDGNTVHPMRPFRAGLSEATHVDTVLAPLILARVKGLPMASGHVFGGPVTDCVRGQGLPISWIHPADTWRRGRHVGLMEKVLGAFFLPVDFRLL